MEIVMSQLWTDSYYKAATLELQRIVGNSVRQAVGLRCIEDWIAKHTKNLVKRALGNAIANFTAHVGAGAAIGNRQPTQEELDHWNAVRQKIHDRYGL
jgi:hypothetical protein